MTHVLVLLLALLIGVIAGLRALTAPAVVAWASVSGWINVSNKWSEWVAHPDHRDGADGAVARGARHRPAAEDAQPARARRSSSARLLTGAFAGAVIGSAFFHTFSSIGAGIIGAVLGTLAGYEARTGWSPPTAVVTCRWRWPRTSSPWAVASWSSTSPAFCDSPLRRDRRRRRAGRSAAGGQADRRRSDRRGDRTQTRRRNVRQRRLHPHQDPGGQCARRPRRAPRRRVRGVDR